MTNPATEKPRPPQDGLAVARMTQSGSAATESSSSSSSYSKIPLIGMAIDYQLCNFDGKIGL